MPARRTQRDSRRRRRMRAAAQTIDIQPAGSSDETLHQRRLREFYDLEKQFLDIRARYVASYKRLQDLVITGAAVQTGNYKLESKIYAQRHPRYKQAVIDLKGEDYQKRILEETAPVEHLRVRVH